ncbi:ParB-like protein [Magnetococcales bacterium HHB-1]
MTLDLDNCTESTQPGTICQLKVSQLNPTQSGIGLMEIDAKVEKLAKKSKKKLQDYLFSKPVPIIIGPQGKFYLTDHHHLSYALWITAKNKNKAGLTPENAAVVVEVKANWRAYNDEYRFWKRMVKEGNVYLFDHTGGGPIQPKELPQQISEMKNDIYRSLAWKMREVKVYLKDPANPLFAEFIWADFFRKNLIIDKNVLKNRYSAKEAKFENPCNSYELRCCRKKLSRSKNKNLKTGCDDFKALLMEARGLAISAAAKGLPGYTGNQ